MLLGSARRELCQQFGALCLLLLSSPGVISLRRFPSSKVSLIRCSPLKHFESENDIIASSNRRWSAALSGSILLEAPE